MLTSAEGPDQQGAGGHARPDFLFLSGDASDRLSQTVSVAAGQSYLRPCCVSTAHTEKAQYFQNSELGDGQGYDPRSHATILTKPSCKNV